MEQNQFRTKCPFCSESYRLDRSLLGRVVSCHKCRKSFRLEEIVETRDDRANESLVSTSSRGSNATNNNSESNAANDAWNDEFDELSPEVIADFAERFPNPPKGVWNVGDVLLDGMCQILPLTKEKLYAEGGVGIVQRARKRDWNIDLIIKSPKPGVVLTEYGKESFERECQTWIELGLHANIVSCYFARRIDGVPRLFAELAPDGTLNDWISDKRIYAGGVRDALAKILDISIQFAWGLQHAHQQGLLHLDVKPGNVMTSGSTIKVTDFGLSKFIRESANDDVGSALNFCDGMTPSYCSPEQFEAFQIYRENKAKGKTSRESIPSAPMTKQSDIWSWAISVLAMFHGRSPCKKGGQTAAKVFDYFITQPPSESKPALPPGMIDLLKWCFREKPSERPDSMQTIADQLVQIYEENIGQKYPRRQPKNTTATPESFSNRAISLLDLGKIDEALGLLHKATRLAPNHPLINFNYQLALWRAGKIRDENVVDQLNRFTQNSPSDASAHYVFGLAHQERGKLQASVNAFKRSLELNPRQKDVKRSLEEIEKLVPYDSLCIMQYVLNRRDETKAPPLYIDDSGEFFLVELVDQKITVLKVQSGRSIATFTSKNSNDKESNVFARSAVSDDFLWKMKVLSPTEAIVYTVERDENARPQISYRFRSLNWGNLQPVAARSPFNANKKDAKSQKELQVVPTNEGVDFVDEQSGELVARIAEDEGATSAFSITPNGKWLAVGSVDSTVHIWNVVENRLMRVFHAVDGVVEALWFDPRARVVVSLAKRNILQIWRVVLICNHPKKIRAPHLLCLINSSEEMQERQAQIEANLKRAEEAVHRDDLHELLQAYRATRAINGWEAERSKFERLLERRVSRSNLDDVEQALQIRTHEGDASALVVAWDASFFVTGGKDNAIRMWVNFATEQDRAKTRADDKKYRQALELDYHYDWVRALALSPNNRFLVSGSWDQSVILWDLATGKRLRAFPEKVKNITQLAFAPDGRTVACASANGNVTLWDVANNEILARLDVGEGYARAFAFSSSGRFFASVTDDSVVRLWTGRSGLPFMEIGNFPSKVISLDISYDEQTLVLGLNDGKIYIVDISQKNEPKRRVLHGHLGSVTALKIFPDGAWLVSIGKDKTARIWNLREGKETRTITNVNADFTNIGVDFSGRTLFAGDELGLVQRWKLLWDYDLQQNAVSNAEIERSLRPIAARCALQLKVASKSCSPREYYQLKSLPPIVKPCEVGTLTPFIIQRIYDEAKERGLCGVTYEIVEQISSSLWNEKMNIS